MHSALVSVSDLGFEATFAVIDPFISGTALAGEVQMPALRFKHHVRQMRRA